MGIFNKQQTQVQGTSNPQTVANNSYTQAKGGRTPGHDSQSQQAYANEFEEVSFGEAYPHSQPHNVQTQQPQYQQPPVQAQPTQQVQNPTATYGDHGYQQPPAMPHSYPNVDGHPYPAQQIENTQSQGGGQSDSGFWNFPSQGLFMLNRIFIADSEIDELTGEKKDPKLRVEGFALVGKKSRKLSYYSIIEVSPKQKNFQDMFLQFKHLIESKSKVSCSMDIGLNFIGTKIKNGEALVTLYFQLFWLRSMKIDGNKVIDNPRPKKQES